jgi:hypothetical protein
MGLAFNRHWTVHYEKAGVTEIEAARFIGRLLKQVGDYVARSKGRGQFAAIWMRENGDGKGGHVHILMRLPPGCTLRGRTRKWVRLAGGAYRRNVSFVRTIAGSLMAAEAQSEHYRKNATVATAYILKGASIEAGKVLGLKDYGQAGLIVGKRCGFTENISPYSAKLI